MIPIGLRAKLKLLEGNSVRISIADGKIILTPVDNNRSNDVIRITSSRQNGQSVVKVSIDSDSRSAKVCGTSGPSSSLGSGPVSGGDDNE